MPPGTTTPLVLNRQGKADRRCRRWSVCSRRSRAIPGYRNLHAAVLANLGDYPGSIRIYEAALQGVSAAAQGLDELRPLAEDHRPAGRQRGGLSARDRDGADARRGVVEPRQPQDLPLRGRRYAAMRERAGARRSGRRGSPALRIRARQGARGRRAPTRSPSPITRAGNALRRQPHPYSADGQLALRAPLAASSSPRSSSPRAPAPGSPARDPIFIVGLPRSGSTLIEQILASHPLVEGTMELPDIPQIARELAARDGVRPERRFLRGAGSADARRAAARSASATWRARASCASAARRSSSTRCRTTACMSG